MSQVNSIREMKKSGMTISEIERETGHDHKTIKKYIEQDDFSPKLPVVEKRPSKLDPFKAVIDEILENDRTEWRKQRHTAKRIYERLRDEYGYDGSYPTVQRYTREKNAEMRKPTAYQDLVWDAGTMQVDFGQADFIVGEVVDRKHYLTMSFPYSNVVFTQVFSGETSECVCQGLQDTFAYLGCVPHTVIFDNATGIGRRCGEELKLAELFEQFQAHYEFTARFCNPRSGWEKGNVENAVGFVRKNLFVPKPALDDVENFNSGLFEKCWNLCDKQHYKKQIDQHALFEDDLKAMLPLPEKPFEVFRSEFHKTDKKGIVKVDSCHHYSTRSDLVQEEVIVVLKAHHVEIHEKNGDLVCRHRRQFGTQRTDTLDPGATLADLRKKPGAWQNSQVRANVEEDLRNWMDKLSKADRKLALNSWYAVSKVYGYEMATRVMEWFAQDGRVPTESDAKTLAERICEFGLNTPPEAGPSLSVYDEAFLQNAGKAGDQA